MNKSQVILFFSVETKKLEMIAIDFSTQEALNANIKSMQQINFTGNLVRDINENTITFFTVVESKETILDHFRFFTGNVENIVICFCLNIKSI